jgi:hypothetical protein
MTELNRCVSKSLIEEAAELLEKYVDFLDHLENRAAHGVADAEMDHIDMAARQLRQVLTAGKSC